MRKYKLILISLVASHLFLLVNLQFTAWPEMLSYPYLVNNGFTLYSDFVHPYPPLLTAALSVVYKIFGYKLVVMQAFTWSLIILNDLLIFKIVYKLTKGNKWALFAVANYIAVQPFLEGNMLWFDLAAVAPLLIALLLSINKKYIYAGIFFGLVVLTKQSYAIFPITVAIAYLIRDRNIYISAKLFVGSIVAASPFVFWLVMNSLMPDFLTWNLINPSIYWTPFPGYLNPIPNLRQTFILVYILAPSFLIFAVLRKKILKNFHIILLFILVLTSLIATYPRFSYFHSQTTFALVSIVFGTLLSKVKSFKAYLPAIYFIGIFFLIINPAITHGWQREARFYGKFDRNLAQAVANSIFPNQRVFLLGPHSGIYVQANRLPTKKWVDNFGWYYEIPGIQDEVLSLWQTQPPDVVFMATPTPGNWFDIGTYRPEQIVTFIEKNYIKDKQITPKIWLWKRR